MLRDDYEDIEYAEICSKSMDFSVNNFKKRMAIIGLCVVAMTVGPGYAYFIQDVNSTALDVRVPFTDEKSNKEFIASISVQLSFAIYGSFALIGMEIAMEIFVGVVSLAPKIVEFEFRKLDEKIEKNQFTKAQTQLTFRNIVQQIMDTDEYVNSISFSFSLTKTKNKFHLIS